MTERIEVTRDTGVHLSALLGRPVLSRSGERVGKVDDVIVHLRGVDHPLVTGLVVKVGAGRVFVPIGRLVRLSEGPVELAKAKVDLRSFERREGEVLLREDILGHRLIDVADAELVRAWDVELQAAGEEWVSCLDTRRPARLFGLIPKAWRSSVQGLEGVRAVDRPHPERPGADRVWEGGSPQAGADRRPVGRRLPHRGR
jgi:sporulation protein YlmC with PRC-barrel domain